MNQSNSFRKRTKEYTVRFTDNDDKVRTNVSRIESHGDSMSAYLGDIETYLPDGSTESYSITIEDDNLTMPTLAYNETKARGLIEKHEDTYDSYSNVIYSSSSDCSSSSSDVAPLHDLPVFEDTDSTVITIESRSTECQEGHTTIPYQKSTIIEKKAVPATCIKAEISSMASLDQLVAQRSCLDTVIRSIRSFPGTDAAMQEWICNALARWSCDELNRRPIVKNGGFEIIMSAMNRHPTVANVQIQGCRALGNLCYDSEKNSVLLREVGGVSVILHAIHTCQIIEDVFSKACYALTTLLQNDPHGVEYMSNYNLINIIVEGMRINNGGATAQRLGCAVLWHLVPVAKPEKITSSNYTTAEIIDIVVNYSMICHLDDSSVQKYSLALLAKCVIADPDDRKSLKIIHEVNNWVILSMKVHPYEPYIMEDGCTVLLHLMKKKSKEKVVDMITTLKLEGVLVESLWEHRDSPPIVESIVAVLAEVAGHGLEEALCISSVRGIPAIVSAMMANINDVHIQRQGCLCLSYLSLHKELRASVGCAGGIYAIVDAMRFYPQIIGIQEHAISALVNLATIQYNAAMISLSDGIPIVEKAGNIYPDQCQNSAETILKLTEKANRSAGRRRPGLLHMKYRYSRFTTSLHDIFNQQRGSSRYRRGKTGQSSGQHKTHEHTRNQRRERFNLFDSLKQIFDDDETTVFQKSETDETDFH
mmetsp:Transcript_40582/g.61546  ORF Transcript_40582/g.61546 Transcript_40582/m.61546 type:complete len:705 (-) Transcript_40582:121-2235(-)